MQPVAKAFEINREIRDLREKFERENSGASRWRSLSEAAVDDFAWERASAENQNTLYSEQEVRRREAVLAQFDQLALACRLAAISPMQLIQDLAERLTGSGAYRDRAFIGQAWDFRAVLASHIEAIDRSDPDSPNILFFKGYMSKKGIDAEAMPLFELRESTLGEGLARSWSRLLGLVLMTLLFTAMAFLAFARYDVS